MKSLFTGSCLFFIPCFIFCSYAQFEPDTHSIETLSNGQTKRMAKRLEKKGSYYNAVEYWESYYQRKPEKTVALAKVAEMNYKLRDYKMAEKYYKTLMETDSENHPKARYWYAMMLKYNGKYDEAKQEFQTFIDRYLADDSKEFQELARKEIEGIDLAKAQQEKPIRANIVHLDTRINNPYTDFAPRQLGDVLYYSSLRSDSVLNVKDLKGVDYYAKIYKASKHSEEGWAAGTPLEVPPNSPKEHTGNLAFSQEGNRMYFTRCKTGRRDVKLKCDIYMSEKKGDTWGEPEKLTEISTKKTDDSHPTIGIDSEGKEYIYFTSNREGGVGGIDIWYAESIGNGRFGAPVNAGATVNTAKDEFTPFYNNTNKTLYFSSNGLVNIGGFDVFAAKGSGGQWQDPVNIGYPLNSSVDDIYFSIDGAEKAGYFVSNRPSKLSLKSETSGDDIYQYNIIKEILLDAFVASKKNPEEPLGDADVSVFTKTGETLNLIATFKTDTAEHFVLPLDPEKTYQVNATKPGFWGAEEVITPENLNVKDTLFRAFLIEEIMRRKIKLKRIYYEFDRYDITRQYKVTLDSLYLVLNENPAFTLEIIGHTDSVGRDEYNMDLGERRAQSAADYLMKKGIAKERLSLSSKGEADPLLPNTKQSGKDDPAGRARNRRVEFKVSTNDPTFEIEIEYPDPKEEKLK